MCTCIHVCVGGGGGRDGRAVIFDEIAKQQGGSSHGGKGEDVKTMIVIGSGFRRINN